MNVSPLMMLLQLQKKCTNRTEFKEEHNKGVT